MARPHTPLRVLTYTRTCIRPSTETAEGRSAQGQAERLCAYAESLALSFVPVYEPDEAGDRSRHWDRRQSRRSYLAQLAAEGGSLPGRRTRDGTVEVNWSHLTRLGTAVNYFGAGGKPRPIVQAAGLPVSDRTVLDVLVRGHVGGPRARRPAAVAARRHRLRRGTPVGPPAEYRLLHRHRLPLRRPPRRGAHP